MEQRTTHEQGLELVKGGHLKEALAYFIAALQEQPQNPMLQNHLGNVYKRLSDFEKALLHYEEALRLEPHHPYILSNLGGFFYQKGEYERAKHFLQQAFVIDPELLTAHLCYGHACSQLAQFDQAQKAYEQVLVYNPKHLEANHNLAMLYIQEGRFKNALPLLQYTLSVHPDPEGFYHLGVIFGTQGKAVEAKAAYEQALEHDPKHDKAMHNLAQVLLSLGEKNAATSYFEKALALDPDNVTAEHMLAALKQSHIPERAAVGFVRSLFDQYADTYDTHLQSQLQYQVPALLRASLAPYVSINAWDVMDLGCGTGLCAPYFTDIAAKLYGIDLSASMLLKAKNQGAYYRLLQGDILETLPLFEKMFDLVIAADVLVYFGNLLPLFSKIAPTLKAGGFFACSCELSLEADYHLQVSGRYAHHHDYLKSCVEQLGWTVRHLKTETLRTQEGLPVQGFILVAQTPTSHF